MTPLSMPERPHLFDSVGATVAPPPTPSVHNEGSCSATTTTDVFSSLICRLPPSLTFTPRTSPAIIPSTAPSVTLTDPRALLPVSTLGFFQIPDCHIPPHVALSAEREATSLFSLSKDDKNQFFPKNWPFGWDDEEEEDDRSSSKLESICLDSTFTSEFPSPCLVRFTRELENLGLEIVEKLARAMQFENPFRSSRKPAGLMWVSDGSAVTTDPVSCTRFYPYVVGLQYQIRAQKYTLMADSGWVSVLPDVDSVLVTLGDIAEVWSNGRVKKVRGRPVGAKGEGNGCRSVVMTLLLSLPLDEIVRPLPFAGGDGDGDSSGERRVGEEEGEEGWRFKPFSFEDYGWRVYHERIHSKDPLNRYRI